MRLRLVSIAILLLSMFSAVSCRANVQTMDQHYESALSSIKRGKTEKAQQELKLSIQENPLNSKSHFLLGLLLWQEAQYDQAIVGFHRATILEPNNAAARYNLGTAMLRRDEPVSAAHQFEEAIYIRPDHVESYNNLAKAYFMAGLPELAVASYKEALRREPTNSVALRNLSVITAAAGGQGVSGSDKTEKTPAVIDTQPVFAAEPRKQEEAKTIALREILRDFPYVTVENRGGQLTLDGWTRDDQERKLLDLILTDRSDVLDLTTPDTGDPHRLLEIDAMIFLVIGLESDTVGHNFLRNVQVTAGYFDANPDPALDWLFSAAIDYQVNIANVVDQRIGFLARPHLTTLSGTPATFIAGGDVIFKVSGTTSGDIRPYPFGTSLEVTPTVLRTKSDGGSPLVRMKVKAGRKSVLPIDTLESTASSDSLAFSNIEVTSEAILELGRSLILTGLSQRESNTVSSGVPILKDIPIIKYLFSSKSTTVSDASVIILLTPRDPAYWDQQNQKAIEEFVEKRRAFVKADSGTEEDMRQFKERYPDWNELAPNRFASHFFLLDSSEIYRKTSGIDLADEDLDFELLGKSSRKK